MHIQIKAIKLSELRGTVFQLWKQKGTFSPLKLYYELGLKILSVTCENKQTPWKQWKDNEAAQREGVLFMCLYKFIWHNCVFSRGNIITKETVYQPWWNLRIKHQSNLIIPLGMGWATVLKVCPCPIGPLFLLMTFREFLQNQVSSGWNQNHPEWMHIW